MRKNQLLILHRIAVGLGDQVQDKGALPQIVEHEGRQDKAYPGCLDRPATEMAHVGIERLGARHRQEDRPQNEQPRHPMTAEEAQGMKRIERACDRRRMKDVGDAQQGDDHEPDHADRAEIAPHAGGSLGLHGKEDHQNGQAGHQNHGQGDSRGYGRNTPQALDGRKNRHSRGDDGVAIEERRARAGQEEDQRRPATDSALGQGRQGQDPALPAIVSPHQEEDVFDRHHQKEGPEGQGGDPHDRSDRHAGLARLGQGLAEGVEGAGADIAENHADTAKGQGPEARVGLVGGRGGIRGRRLGFCGRGEIVLTRHEESAP